MIKTRFSLQALLLTVYLMLIIGMIQNLVFDLLWGQRNEILPASILFGVFIICFISGIFNVFYFKAVSKKLYWTFIFYLFLPFSIPLIILEVKFKSKINNENNFEKINQQNFIRNFLIVTTVLQVIELFLMFGTAVPFSRSSLQGLKIIAWWLLILVVLILIGLTSSWIYFVTNKKFFKIMMIFNFLFGWPLFFLNFIMTNHNKSDNFKKSKNYIKLIGQRN